MSAQIDLLEREIELESLRAAIHAAVGRAGRLVAIQGQAGIGKTRLLAAARQVATDAGIRVLFARGSVLERSFAYGVVRQLFEPMLAREEAPAREEILTGAAALARPLFESRPMESTRRPSEEGTLAVIHGLFWLAANAAERDPLLLAIDDLHWSDTASLEWLGYLLRRLEGLPILIVVALRPGEPGSDADLLSELLADPLSTLLQPGPLSPAAVQKLVEAILGTEAVPEFCDACVEASGGSPLLLVELLQGLAAEGIAPCSAGITRVRDVGPTAVSQSVRLRLRHLPPEARAFARALAVLGDGAELTLAAALADITHGAAADAASLLRNIDVLERKSAPAFVHPLVRDAIYLEMSPGQRADAHARAGSLISGRLASPEQVAAHLLLAPCHGNDATVATLREAAQEALGRSAPSSAAVYLKRALEEPPAAEQRSSLLFELGSVEILNREPEAEAHLRQALAGEPDAAAKAEIELTLGRLLFWRHAPVEAVTLLEEALSASHDQPPQLRAKMEAELVGIALSYTTTHATGAERLAHLQAGMGEGVGRKMLLAFAAYKDMLHCEGRDYCVERTQSALSGGHLLDEEASMAFISAGITLVYSDRFDLADKAFGEGRRVAQTRGAAATFTLSSAGIARMLGDRLQLLDAEADARAALAACPEGHLICGQYAASILAHVLIKRGDLTAAAEVLSWGGFSQSDLPRSLHTANPLAIRGRLHLVRGEAAAALADFLAIGELLEPVGCRNPAISYWRSLAALSLLQLGDQQEARRLAEEELGLARDWGGPAMIGRALLALGLVEGGRKGIELLHEAVSVLEQSTARYDLLQARVELGAALRRANKRAAARELLRRCLDKAQTSGAGLLAGRAHEELLMTGARPRRLRVSGVDALTASERRVAGLASQGLSNREIAQSLFVTTKTVEMHLARVFNKLQIRSRTEIPGDLSLPAEA